MAALSSVAALERLLEPHLQAGRERDPHQSMMCLSPPDTPSASSSESEDDDREDDGGPGWQKDKRPTVAPARQLELQAQASHRKARVVFSAAQPGAGAHVFPREPVAVGPGSSHLTAMLERLSASDGRGPAAPIEGARQIKVFCVPVSGGVVELEVGKSTTGTQVVEMALARAATPGATGLVAGGYELLMADDGLPDDDFPPLGDKLVAEFGSDFALRRAPPAVAAAAEAKANAEAAAAADAGGSERAAKAGMRVHLPREAFGQRLEQWVITQPYRTEMLLADLMQEVCRKRAVRLHPSKHVFTLPDGRGPLDMGALLGSIELPRNHLGQPEICVAPRTYLDAPPPASRRGKELHNGGDGLRGGVHFRGEEQQAEDHVKREASTAPIEFVFSDVTAAQYKEYQVIKVNRRGVKQARLLGIDHLRFYNLAHSQGSYEADKDDWNFSDWTLKVVRRRQANGGTKVPFRPMKDALDAQVAAATCLRTALACDPPPPTLGSGFWHTVGLGLGLRLGSR